MQFIIEWLARLFEAFKTKNPLVAAIVLTIAATVLNGVQNATFYDLFTLPEWGQIAVQWVSTFVLAVTGSQTFRYLPKEKQATAR